MTNIVKTQTPPTVAATDPFRMMREMLRWDPFRTMAPSFTALEGVWNPSFEVRESGDSFLFKADLPGLRAEDVEVTLAGHRLQVAGKREAEKETKDDTVYVYERSYGDFCRTFTLPEGADLEHIKSEMKDGVLTVVVPKKAMARPTKIAIATADAPKS